jgi:hypothetical protein
METRELYHGTTGDNILQILRYRQMRPNAEGKIFFSQRRYDSVLMHGADKKRMLTFAIKARVHVPEGATLDLGATPGVADTLVLNTTGPVTAEVLDLYVRKPRASQVETVHGATNIERFLKRMG